MKCVLWMWKSCHTNEHEIFIEFCFSTVVNDERILKYEILGIDLFAWVFFDDRSDEIFDNFYVYSL